MNWSIANKQQLLQIAMNENCELESKYESVRELQLRWTQDMLTDVVIMYGRGMHAKRDCGVFRHKSRANRRYHQ